MQQYYTQQDRRKYRVWAYYTLKIDTPYRGLAGVLRGISCECLRKNCAITDRHCTTGDKALGSRIIEKGYPGQLYQLLANIYLSSSSNSKFWLQVISMTLKRIWNVLWDRNVTNSHGSTGTSNNIIDNTCIFYTLSTIDASQPLMICT